MLLLTTTGRRFGPAAAVARLTSLHTTQRSLSAIPNWATLDPASLGARNSEPYAVSNIVNGLWCTSNASMTIPNPMDKDAPPGKNFAIAFNKHNVNDRYGTGDTFVFQKGASQEICTNIFVPFSSCVFIPFLNYHTCKCISMYHSGYTGK